MTETRNAEPRNAAPRWLKPATDYGPLAVFLIAYALQGLMAATAALLAATLVALALALFYERRVPAMPLLTAGVVLVFGGLTLWLQDETFIKMKPTIVNGLFAAVLLGGLAFGKSLLGHVFDAAFRLDEAGWRKLTLRWGLFFIFLAAANEVIWRSFSTDFWVAFKVWGIMPITVAFTFAQMPLILRHSLEDIRQG